MGDIRTAGVIPHPSSLSGHIVTARVGGDHGLAQGLDGVRDGAFLLFALIESS
jgi:hypothetical protein